MEFSLVLATYGADKEVYITNFMHSLENQVYRNFELIIVDQNEKSYIPDILHNHDFTYYINYIKSKPGLSISRNSGLDVARYDIIAFPDDDCVYPSTLLNEVNDFFIKNDYDILAIETRDVVNHQPLPYTRKITGNMVLSKDLVFKVVTSISIFCKNIEETRFDKDMGLGAYFQSCEEIDFVTQLIKNGKVGFVTNELYVLHPNHITLDNQVLIQKIKRHSPGHGAYFCKHFLYLKFSSFYNLLIAPVGGMIKFALKLDLNNFRIYKCYFLYRIKGFVEYFFKS